MEKWAETYNDEEKREELKMSLLFKERLWVKGNERERERGGKYERLTKKKTREKYEREEELKQAECEKKRRWYIHCVKENDNKRKRIKNTREKLERVKTGRVWEKKVMIYILCKREWQ